MHAVCLVLCAVKRSLTSPFSLKIPFTILEILLTCNGLFVALFPVHANNGLSFVSVSGLAFKYSFSASCTRSGSTTKLSFSVCPFPYTYNTVAFPLFLISPTCALATSIVLSPV